MKPIASPIYKETLEMIGAPIHFPSWIEEHKDKLKPPVNNFLVQRGDFIIMAVGGPNKRNDFHVNPTEVIWRTDSEEWFYQYKGDMELRINENGVFRTVDIKEGEMFLLPANTPHNPIRFADTIGIVIEKCRPAGMNAQRLKEDHLRWYCEKCSAITHEESFYCSDLGVQLKPVIEKVANDCKLRTCPQCHFVNPAK